MIEYTVPVPISRLVDDDASLDDDIEGPHELFTRSIENLFRELTRWEEEAEPGRLQNRIALDLRMKRETAAPQEDAKNTKQPQLRLTRHTLPRLSYIVDKFGLLPGIWVGGSRWHVHVAPASVMYLARMLGSGLRELMFHTVVMGFSADDICARSGMNHKPQLTKLNFQSEFANDSSLHRRLCPGNRRNYSIPHWPHKAHYHTPICRTKKSRVDPAVVNAFEARCHG